MAHSQRSANQARIPLALYREDQVPRIILGERIALSALALWETNTDGVENSDELIVHWLNWEGRERSREDCFAEVAFGVSADEGSCWSWSVTMRTGD